MAKYMSLRIQTRLIAGETAETEYAGNKGKANADAITALQESVSSIATKNGEQDKAITSAQEAADGAKSAAEEAASAAQKAQEAADAAVKPEDLEGYMPTAIPTAEVNELFRF